VSDRRLELFATVLLAVAALATAWSTYQSTQWRGEQAANYSKGTAARIQSAEAATRAGQKTQVDIAVFSQWVDAYAVGNKRLAAFYRRRFRDEFVPAFNAWLASKPLTNPHAAKSPFELPQYVVSDTVESKQLDAQATAHSTAAETANQRSDNYVLAVVLLASALFFAGISTKLHSVRHREALLVLGWILFIGTVIWIIASPVRVSV